MLPPYPGLPETNISLLKNEVDIKLVLSLMSPDLTITLELCRVCKIKSILSLPALHKLSIPSNWNFFLRHL